jgi:hypothetical protein
MTRPFEGEDNEGECNRNFGGGKSFSEHPGGVPRRQKAEELTAIFSEARLLPDFGRM